jgi:hypothetical protein
MICRCRCHCHYKGLRGKNDGSGVYDTFAAAPKSSHLLYLFYFIFIFICLSIFVHRVFGRFVTRRLQKRDKKIAEIFPQPRKKALTHLRLFYFYAPPWPLPPGAGQ